MVDRDRGTMSSPPEAFEILVRHLCRGDEVIRCAAAKALGKLADSKAAPALIQALLDEDPDVRTDVMESLIVCARPDDGSAIVRSLAGDPVKEVKIFAIRALAHLNDHTSLPLIRRLAKERAEDEVSWEDDTGMWDDWLDVQIAAIQALGNLQPSNAIDDLLEARADEMGQELDDVIFPTLAEIADGGVVALLGFLRDHNPKTLLPMRDLLLADQSPEVRKLAIPAVNPASTTASDLTRRDPDIEVRKAALRAFGRHRLDLLQAALEDPNESIQAIALKMITDSSHDHLPTDLADNVQAWMAIADIPLATIAAELLPQLRGDSAGPPLCRIAEMTDRPLDVRIAALTALSDTSGPQLIETLSRCLSDPMSQIRAAALASLASLAEKRGHVNQHDSAQVLTDAIRGNFGTNAVPHPLVFEQESDLGATKVDGGPGHVKITPDGEVVTGDADPTVIEGYFPQSTLDAVQTISFPGNQQPSDRQKPMKRRVPIDGPSDIATDIRLVALAMAQDCGSKLITTAMIAALTDDKPSVRAAAFRSLARRSGTIEQSVVALIEDALEDPEAAIRHDAARILEHVSPDRIDARLSLLLEDEDSMVRSIAIGRLGKQEPAIALRALEDNSNLVRRAGLDSLIESGNLQALHNGFQVCLAKGHADLLGDSLERCPLLRKELLSCLDDKTLSRLQTLTALEALATA